MNTEKDNTGQAGGAFRQPGKVSVETVGQVCRYCNQPITGQPDTTYAYWDSAPREQRQSFLCHPECKTGGIKQEAYECQLIDADCNDCRHFRRGQVVKRWLSCMENKKPSMRLVNMGFITGHCVKFDRPTIAQPNKWTGLECFEHRQPAIDNLNQGEG